MQAGKSVIFCATQRTGSCMVFDDLRNVLGYGPAHDSEILYDRIIRKEAKCSWSDVWAEVSEVNRIEGYFVGKVMFHYTPRISSFIERSTIAGVERCLSFTPELFDSFYRFFADSIWVYIYRRDVFAQAVSMYLAERTEIWERRVDDPPETCSPTSRIGYDYEQLKQYLQGFLAEREQWQVFFQHYNIKPVTINYEEAVGGYPHYLTELLNIAGLRMVEAPWQRRLLKLGDHLNEQFVELLRNDVILDLCSRNLTTPSDQILPPQT
jgi:LPS sulfotransferase NodH